ncbi:MAG TPA: hypothetical protein VNN80_25555 [Polyangiaceae bacterium]|nr:hypothetical protein [Polyangiaceae bacterium]
MGGRGAVGLAQEPLRVLVLEPVAPTALEHELLTRLTGELDAAGVEVLCVPLPVGSDPAAAVATQGSEFAAVAAYAAREEVGASGSSVKTLRLWLGDRVTGAALAEDGRDDDASALASSLAVQGFELLQAREAEWGWKGTPPPPAPARAVPSPPSVPPEPAPEGELTAGMHVGVLLDAPTGGSSLTPLVRFSYAPAATHGLGAFDLGVRLSLAGFGSPTVVESGSGRIDVVQSFGLLELVATLEAESWVRPFASAGAGAYHIDVNGVGSGQIVGRSEATLSPVGAAGLGLGVQPWRNLFGQLEAQGLFALHPTGLDSSGTRAATFGRPLLVFSFGLGVTW